MGNYDSTSICFGLTLVDELVFVNNPEIILADEYTKAGREKVSNMNNVGDTKQ